MISIIIPYFNNWSLTYERLGEIYKHLTGDFEVVLVNDASTDLDCRASAGWWMKYITRFPVRYVENSKNLGFGGSHNKGAKKASGNILVFLSNDVVISGNFLPKIEAILYEHKNEVIVAGEVLSNDTGWNMIFLHGKPAIISYPVGWLIAVSRDMWKRIGGWDVETYGKFDYEDVDLGAWAVYNGVDTVGLYLPFLKHLSGQTINPLHPDREKYTIKNREAFRNKWTTKLEERFL